MQKLQKSKVKKTERNFYSQIPLLYKKEWIILISQLLMILVELLKLFKAFHSR